MIEEKALHEAIDIVSGLVEIIRIRVFKEGVVDYLANLILHHLHHLRVRRSDKAGDLCEN
jgi:hypothetical protein